MQMTVEAAVSAALLNANACYHRDYFAASDATIFSKHGSLRSRPYQGDNFNVP
jgi:hypothetical protein